MALNSINLFYINIELPVLPSDKFFRWLRITLMLLLLIILALSWSSCRKIIKIDSPVNTITSNETFNSEANAVSAIIAIYNNMTIQSGPGFANGATTLYAGLSSDEIKYFPNNPELFQFQSNEILPDNSRVKVDIWDKAYFNIYQASAVIEGLTSSNGVSESLKPQLIGEAKFLRAFCYFYLINFYGDVPLVTSTNWSSVQFNKRASVENIYQQIISDLEDAKLSLPGNYLLSNNERTRANKYAATSLLSRVYLYKGDWLKAEVEAASVIQNTVLYGLEADLDKVFLINSKEAIWQLEVSNSYSPYATREGLAILPPNATSSPRYYLTTELINAFDTADRRKSKWVKNTVFANTSYPFPNKYKIRVGTSGNVLEYYTVFRLAEQYLIRSEAQAKQNKLVDAISDLNVLRKRAGLEDLPTNLNQSQVLAAVLQEKRIELFSEWGHRWFDLKRTGQANSIIGQLKGASWQSTDQLYPIPVSEIVANPNLIQNPGY